MRAILFISFTIVGVILTFSLSGCASETKTIREGVQTKEVILRRTYEAQKVCSAMVPQAPGWTALACTQYNEGACMIYLNPLAEDHIWGHELRHCFDGSWHRG